MSAIQHILCATDFSDTAMLAVSYAEKLAIELGAQLTLVHAFDTPITWNLASQEVPRERGLEEQLNSTLATSTLGEKLHRRQHAGPAGEVICWLAQDSGCDLIIVGTHGRTGLRHLLMGSVAEHVMRHARCPVLTVRDRDPAEPPLPQPVVMPVPAPRFM